jgi:hypothetical protein
MTTTTATATRLGDTVFVAIPDALPFREDLMDMFISAADRIGAEWSLWPSNYTGEWVTTIAISGGEGWVTLPLNGDTVAIGTL